VRGGKWKTLTVFVCGTGPQYTVAPAGGHRPMGSRPSEGNDNLHDKYLTVTCFLETCKLLNGYETGINKKERIQAKGQGGKRKITAVSFNCSTFMHSCSIRNRRCSVMSVSSIRTEEGEQRVDPLFEDMACSAALRRSFMALSSSSSF